MSIKNTWATLPKPLTLEEIFSVLSSKPNAYLLGIASPSYSELSLERSFVSDIGKVRDELEDTCTEASQQWWSEHYQTVLLVSGQERCVFPIEDRIGRSELVCAAYCFNGTPRRYERDHFPTKPLYHNNDGRWYIQGKENDEETHKRLARLAGCDALDMHKRYLAKYYTDKVFEVFEIIEEITTETTIVKTDFEQLVRHGEDILVYARLSRKGEGIEIEKEYIYHEPSLSTSQDMMAIERALFATFNRNGLKDSDYIVVKSVPNEHCPYPWTFRLVPEHLRDIVRKLVMFSTEK